MIEIQSSYVRFDVLKTFPTMPMACRTKRQTFDWRERVLIPSPSRKIQHLDTIISSPSFRSLHSSQILTICNLFFCFLLSPHFLLLMFSTKWFRSVNAMQQIYYSTTLHPHVMMSCSIDIHPSDLSFCTKVSVVCFWIRWVRWRWLHKDTVNDEDEQHLLEVIWMLWFWYISKISFFLKC